MRKIFTSALLILCFILWGSPEVMAAEPVPGEDFSFEGLSDYIPEEVLTELPEELFSLRGTEAAEAVDKLLDPGKIVSLILSAITSVLPGMLSGMMGIIGAVILASAFRGLSASLSNRAAAPSVELASGLVTVLILFSSERAVFESVKLYLDRLIFFMNGMLPTMGGIYLLGGNTGSAAVHSGTTMLILTAVENGAAYLLMPMLRVCFCFILITALSGGALRTDGIMRAVKTLYTGLLGVVTTVLVTVLASRNIISAAGDTFTVRTAKLAVGNLIPVVGGSISDSLGTISAGLTLIKNGAGILGIVLILMITLPMTVTLLCNGIILSFSAFAADVLGCEKEKKMIEECKELSGLALGLSSMAAAVFILSVVVFVSTNLAISGG